MFNWEKVRRSCKGKVYRAEVNIYTTERGFNKTIKLRQLVKESCKGCKSCEWINYYFQETIEAINNFQEIIHGKKYELERYNFGYDEYGNVDDWEVRLIRKED